MKKTITLLFLSLCIAVFSSPVYALTLTLDPSTQTVNSGDNFFLNLNVSGLTEGGPDSLGSFSVNVSYDSALFGFADVAFGTALGDPDFFEADAFFIDSLGSLYLDEVSFLLHFELDAIQGSSFTLATIQFTSLGLGSGTFGLSGAVLSNAFGNSLTSVIENANVTSVASVPDAPIAILLGTSLLGLVGLGRKKIKR